MADGKETLRGRLTRQPDQSTYRVADDGMVTATEAYICLWEDVPRLMPVPGRSRHPDFNFLVCFGDVTAGKIKPGVARISATYAGLSQISNETQQLPPPVREVGSTVSEEPLEANPRFESHIAGTAESPKNGAIFNDDGTFKEFGPDSDKRGVESYLLGQPVYRYSEVLRNEPSPTGVGKIDAPPNAPSVSGGHNWLKIEDNFSEEGGAFRRTRAWLLSGPNGWDEDIYG